MYDSRGGPGPSPLPRGERANLRLFCLRGVDEEPAAAVPERGRAEFQGKKSAHAFFTSLLKNTAARGGTVIVRVCGRPWAGTGTASAPPMFPCPLPPYSRASLFSTSRQTPPRGTPTR